MIVLRWQRRCETPSSYPPKPTATPASIYYIRSKSTPTPPSRLECTSRNTSPSDSTTGCHVNCNIDVPISLRRCFGNGLRCRRLSGSRRTSTLWRWSASCVRKASSPAIGVRHDVNGIVQAISIMWLDPGDDYGINTNFAGPGRKPEAAA